MKIVFLTGAGISAESGIKTFRDSEDGIWNHHKIEDVCTSNAFDNDPDFVNAFYNERRIDVLDAVPNAAHIAIAALEKDGYDVSIITTNVDDLHERAGSTNVVHLHGEILKARSSNPIYDWAGMSPDESVNNYPTVAVGREGIRPSDVCAKKYPMRPDIVFFGESVPKIGIANDIVKSADYFVVVGTSLSVAPANSLVWSTNDTCKVFYIDNKSNDTELTFPCRFYNSRATVGVANVIDSIKGFINA